MSYLESEFSERGLAVRQYFPPASVLQDAAFRGWCVNPHAKDLRWLALDRTKQIPFPIRWLMYAWAGWLSHVEHWRFRGATSSHARELQSATEKAIGSVAVWCARAPWIRRTLPRCKCGAYMLGARMQERLCAKCEAEK